MTTDLQAAGRTYRVRTYGCQMNVHDSERLSGLLEAAGYAAAPEGEDADVVVLNTCAVRENADNRLYGNLGHLRPVKDAHPGMQIAVGGCLAQKDRGEIVKRAPWVDVVFGTHNVGSLPALLERARHNAEAQVEIKESLEVFPSTLPGQNVNSYGSEFGDRGAFADLLRAAGAIDGLERLRFTSPHPRDFTDDVIAAMAETPAVCHQLHMPLQSGSDDVLRRVRRAHRLERYLGIIERVRPGTPAAEMDGQLPKGVVQERYERLTALQDDISWAENRALVGRTVELLVAAGGGGKDARDGGG